MNYFQISEISSEPKYKQLIRSIEKSILNGFYKRGDKLPSINGIKLRFSVSRDTVLLAYSNLKSRGIIQSIPGKGYYVKTENVSTVQKIFLLFDEFNSFKEDLYNSFLNNLKDGVEVDIYFHHFNEAIFSKLIFDNIGVYNTYVIMPANLKNVKQVLENLPKEAVYILDQTFKELEKYPSIVQDFKKDIIEGLTEVKQQLKNYDKLVLLYAENKQPKTLHIGFVEFCKENNFKFEIIPSLEEQNLKYGEAYLIPDDRNLIRIIKKMKEKEFTLSKDIGIISYNDTLLKEIVEGGITTISTDFKKMGATLANMVQKKEKQKIHNPSMLILRNSL
jgi:DNA-binding transcriptional regulator YhcF (GntR family)